MGGGVRGGAGSRWQRDSRLGDLAAHRVCLVSVAAWGRYLGQADVQSGGTHPRGDQHGSRTIGPHKGRGLQGQPLSDPPPPFLLSFCAQMETPPNYRRAGV